MRVGKNEEEKKEKQFLQKLKSIFVHGLGQKYHEIIIMTKVLALNCWSRFKSFLFLWFIVIFCKPTHSKHQDHHVMCIMQHFKLNNATAKACAMTSKAWCSNTLSTLDNIIHVHGNLQSLMLLAMIETIFEPNIIVFFLCLIMHYTFA